MIAIFLRLSWMMSFSGIKVRYNFGLIVCDTMISDADHGRTYLKLFSPEALAPVLSAVLMQF